MYTDYRAMHKLVDDRQRHARQAIQEDRNYRIATGKPLHRPNVVVVIATLLLKAIGMG